MSSFPLIERVLWLVPMWLSLTVHEFSHAWSARRLGDLTAEQAGRLTLNPLSHIDLIGTLVLPLLGVPFGWAKPVPVDPTQFDRRVNMRTGMLLTALAGPIANLVLAVLASVAFGLFLKFSPQLVLRGSGLNLLFSILIQVNVVLALFNLIPIYPLDGSRILDRLIPDRLRPYWSNFNRLAPILLIVLMLFGAQVINRPVQFVSNLLYQLLAHIAT